MTRFSTEFENILQKYENHKIDSYNVLELLGDDYTFQNYGKEPLKRYTEILNCGTFLQFNKVYHDGKPVYHLTASNFCRQRICPMCMFRKSEKAFAEYLQVTKELEKDYRFIHLVLTIPNAKDGQELLEAIDILFKGFNTFMKYKPCRKAFKGSLRCLEISFNNFDSNFSFHPHLHCLMVVNRSYFNDSNVYLKQETVRELWTKAVNTVLLSKPFKKVKFAKTDKLFQVYLRAFRDGNAAEGVAEVCKYCVKPLEFKNSLDEVTQARYKRFLLTLLDTLKGRRFVQRYGIIKDTYNRLFKEGESEIETDSDEVVSIIWDDAALSYKGVQN